VGRREGHGEASKQTGIISAKFSNARPSGICLPVDVPDKEAATGMVVSNEPPPDTARCLKDLLSCGNVVLESVYFLDVRKFA
jgi:hypothetical protein